jgi:Ca2+-binding RTX toxin-like protein
VTRRWPDTLTGGNDFETFRFSNLTPIIASADLITDYDDVSDTIHLQGLGSALPTFGNFR